MTEARAWFLYLIRCRGGSLYTGVAIDIERRLAEHRSQGPRAAKFLRGRAPLALVFAAEVGDKRRALRLERAVKRLSKPKKEALVSGRLMLEDLLS